MEEKELQEFSLEDIMNEFHDAPNEEELKALAEEGISFEPAEAAEEPVAEEPEIVTEELPAEEPVEEEPVMEAPAREVSAEEAAQSVTGDTIRIDTAQFGKGEVHNAAPVEEPAQTASKPMQTDSTIKFTNLQFGRNYDPTNG